MEKKIRFFVGIGLGLLIIAMIIFIVLNKDKMFNQEINLTYPDGCIEKYHNGELITPICQQGRDMQKPIINFTPINITQLKIPK